MAQVTWLPAWWIILCRAEMFQAPVVALVSLFKQFAFTGVYLVSPVTILAQREPILTQYILSASFHT
jgi:hypothetical protein